MSFLCFSFLLLACACLWLLSCFRKEKNKNQLQEQLLIGVTRQVPKEKNLFCGQFHNIIGHKLNMLFIKKIKIVIFAAVWQEKTQKRLFEERVDKFPIPAWPIVCHVILNLSTQPSLLLFFYYLASSVSQTDMGRNWGFKTPQAWEGITPVFLWSLTPLQAILMTVLFNIRKETLLDHHNISYEIVVCFCTINQQNKELIKTTVFIGYYYLVIFKVVLFMINGSYKNIHKIYT